MHLKNGVKCISERIMIVGSFINAYSAFIIDDASYAEQGIKTVIQTFDENLKSDMIFPERKIEMITKVFISEE